MTYDDHILRKSYIAPVVGIADAHVVEPWLSPFQRHAVQWALAGGRRAMFEDTGMGKTRQELAFADHVHRHTGGRVLLLAPLAVGAQTAQEAASVGLSGVAFAQSPADTAAPIVVSNYDAIDKWDAEEFAGVVLDESGILKDFMGRMRAKLTQRFASTPFRLAATATPAPNDFEELGNHAEFLGHGTRAEMLSRFFVNDSSDTGTWRIKGHAMVPFWDWVASWALCAGMPSDVGPYDDTGYILPPLRVHNHIVHVDLTEDRGTALFRNADVSATGIHGEKRRTAAARAAEVARIIDTEPEEHWIIWCDTDYEAEAIRAAVRDLVEVSGSMTPGMKADRLLGFAANGGRLLTKAKIAGWGLNFQRCARMVDMASYSYEGFYQKVRRCWRFGQARPVDVHIVCAYTESHLLDVTNAKAERHEEMKAAMFAASRRAQANHIRRAAPYNPRPVRVPAWLTTQDE